MPVHNKTVYKTFFISRGFTHKDKTKMLISSKLPASRMLRNNWLLILLVVLPHFLLARPGTTGRILDAHTKETVPFATIRFGQTGQGMVAGLDGSFELPREFSNIDHIEVSCLGYKPKK